MGSRPSSKIRLCYMGGAIDHPPIRVRQLAGSDFFMNECMGDSADECPLSGSQFSPTSGRLWPPADGLASISGFDLGCVRTPIFLKRWDESARYRRERLVVSRGRGKDEVFYVLMAC